MASTSTRRTSPVSCMSTPSRTPSGLAVMKLPLETRMRAPAIGELAMPSDSSASMRLLHLARGLEHAVHRLGVGDAQAERVAALDALLREDGLDLRPRAVDDDDVHAEAVQQVEVVDDAEERLVGDDLAAEGDDEGPAAEGVDVRRRQPDPLHERARRRGAGGGRGVAGRGHGSGRGRGVRGRERARRRPIIRFFAGLRESGRLALLPVLTVLPVLLALMVPAAAVTVGPAPGGRKRRPMGPGAAAAGKTRRPRPRHP